MIKNIMQAVTDYRQTKEQAIGTYKQAVKYITGNYVEGSVLYEEAMKTAKDVYRNAMEPLKTDFLGRVVAEFDNTRKAIREAVAKPPTTEVVNFMEVIKSGKVNDLEKQMILEQHNSNYMDSKLLHHAFGEHFTTVEAMMRRIDDLEKHLLRYPNYDYETDDYYVKLIENDSLDKDSWILTVGNASEEFIDTYK